ncbi:MAG: recombination mediator RecR [Clostridia bacterium]
MYSQTFEKLVAQFTKLASVGNKTAQRYAFNIVDMPQNEVEEFASAMLEAKKTIHFCKECGNYTDSDICEICRTRDKSLICVVSEPKDIIAIEKTKEFFGVYHVLFGAINPMKNISPSNLKIKELLARLDNVSEIILATNPDIEGDATALYLAKLIKPLGVKVTRLAHGISIGSNIEYTDEVTLSKAMAERKEL